VNLVEVHALVVVAVVVVPMLTAVQAQVRLLLFLIQLIQRKIFLHCWEQLVVAVAVATTAAAVLLWIVVLLLVVMMQMIQRMMMMTTAHYDWDLLVDGIQAVALLSFLQSSNRIWIITWWLVGQL